MNKFHVFTPFTSKWIFFAQKRKACGGFHYLAALRGRTEVDFLRTRVI